MGPVAKILASAVSDVERATGQLPASISLSEHVAEAVFLEAFNNNPLACRSNSLHGMHFRGMKLLEGKKGSRTTFLF